MVPSYYELIKKRFHDVSFIFLRTRAILLKKQKKKKGKQETKNYLKYLNKKYLTYKFLGISV